MPSNSFLEFASLSALAVPNSERAYACTIRLVKEAWENRHSLNWWVAPSYAQSKMAYNLVKRLLP
jgi:hypothetical protein